MKISIHPCRLIIITVIISFLGSCGGSSNYSATIAEGHAAATDMMAQTGASSISLALVANGQIVWTETFGLADKEAARRPNADTMFGIGSVSKMLATVATMKLVDQGKISLDEPITTYIRAFSMLSPDYNKITVRMLINHSSGFPGTDYRNASTSGAYLTYADQLMESLSNERLKHEPGFLNTYCNDGFSMTENLIKSVTGKSYVQFVQDEILTPLQMDHSRYPLEAFPAGSYAVTYTGTARNPFLFGNVYASGGFYSTPSDMAKLSLMIIGNGTLGRTTILSKSSIDAMAVNQTIGTFDPAPSENESYGLGWDTVSQGGLKAVGVKGWLKGGDIDGYGAAMLVAPDQKLAVIVEGASALGSSNATVIAERMMLRALVEQGTIAAFPTPLPATPKPLQDPTADELAAISGYFAGSNSLYRMDVNGDNSLTLNKYDGTSWAPLPSVLKMRTDGMFSDDASPLKEFFTASGDGMTYIVVRSPSGYGHYQDDQTSLQKITATTPLTQAWSDRITRTWLLVNERPDSLAGSVYDPRLNIVEPTGLTGLIAVNVHDGGFSIVNPNASDSLAEMMLVMPQSGRDINDLFIVSQGAEEWVRYGSNIYRPMETVPALAVSGGTIVIGADGYTEWRTIASGGTTKTVTVTTNGVWRIFDPAITWISNQSGSGTITLPAISGNYYLEFYGNAGDSITVSSTSASSP